MSQPRRRSPATALLCVPLLGLAACGGLSTRADGAAAPADTGICGTHMDPGILTLTNLTPALGATVNNQAIVHGFTVVRAPAEFSNFDLKFGPSHTAGQPTQPTPEKPKFHLTIVGSDIIYQLTIDSWAQSPGHVELVASGGYDLGNCTWNFPSPLFSYDVTGGPDGGVAPPEAGGRVDSPATPIDAALDGTFPLDVPEGFDLPADEAQGGLDVAVSAESGTSLDGAIRALDGTID